MLNKLEIIKLEHIPKSANKMDDALASFVATLLLGTVKSMNVLVCNQLVVTPLDEYFEKDINAVSA